MLAPSYTLIDETPHFLVISKDHGLPTVPLKKDVSCDSLLKQVSHFYPEVLGVSHEGFILHRLDTATRGLVLIARSIEVYNYFKEEQRLGRFIKTYHATSSWVDTLPPGYPPLDVALDIPGVTEITSSFRPYGKGRREVRPVTDESNRYIQDKGSGRIYSSSVTYLKKRDNNSVLFSVSLTKGFRHQVRNHLCWAHYPIIGDLLYGGEDADFLHLIASKIQFYDYESRQLREYSLCSDGIDPFEDAYVQGE